MKEDLLFYSAYENFYEMAQKSECFKKYCISAFGADFSQDGFSDINQIKLILQYIPNRADLHILDIGCGNGKMLKYLQNHTGGHIYGFDFSENAINSACNDNTPNSDFKVGVIGEINYPSEMFDLIISMDTMYFAKDMDEFVGQVYSWLKKDGIFFIGYQEGDLMAKTDNSGTTVLAKALRNHNLKYDVTDITKQTYDMLNQKRKAIIHFENDFTKENLQDWYSVILHQTDSAIVTFDEYKNKNARYIYIVRK